MNTTDIVIHEVRSDTATTDSVDTDVSPDPTTTCPVSITLATTASTIAAAGTWNDFSESATPLERASAGAPFTTTIRLVPGEYAFKFVIDGTFEGTPPGDVPTHWHDGVENRNLRVPDCHGPTLTFDDPVVAPTASPDRWRITTRLCAGSGESGSPIDLETLTVSVGGEAPTPSEQTPTATDDGTCIDIDVTRTPGKYSLRAAVSAEDGRSTTRFVPLWVEAKPFDWRDASLYMTMVDRFIDTDGRDDRASGAEDIANHMGGDFAGLANRIRGGYLDSLGFNALWLAPVQENAAGSWLGSDNVHRYTGYHGYWPTSAFAIDPRLAEDGAESPEAAFDALVKAAHDRGIRVVMDVVLNHVHEDHAYCVDTPEVCKRTCVCGQDGCDWNARALDCQFAPYLPDLDYRDHATVQRVVDDVMTFIERHDIDALRIDAVKHVDRVILTNLRARIDALDSRLAPFWLVGETFTGGEGRDELMGAIGRGALDGQFDFPLYWAIRDTFVNGGSFRGLEGAIAACENVYGAALPWMSPFAGNHDVERLATALARNDQGPFGATPDVMETVGDTPQRWDVINPMSLAFAFTLSLRGVPLLYAGDEVGLAGSGDPDNRRMLPLTLSADRAELFQRIQALGRLRRDNAVLRRGERREIWLDDDLYVQARWLDAAPEDGSPRIVVIAMNRGATRTVDVTLPDELGAVGTRLVGLNSERRFDLTARNFALTLDPWEYVFLKVE